MSTETMPSRSVFLRTTDNNEKKVTFDERRAWDVDRFMAAIQRQYRDRGAKDKEPERYTVEMITVAQAKRASIKAKNRAKHRRACRGAR